MDGLKGKKPSKWMIWGYPHFRKPPNQGVTTSSGWEMNGQGNSCLFFRCLLMAKPASGYLEAPSKRATLYSIQVMKELFSVETC